VDVQSALAEGKPVALGIAVYPSFESTYTLKTGIVKMPGADEKPLGGHAVVLVGYLNETR
jgi:hypothetical protein